MKLNRWWCTRAVKFYTGVWSAQRRPPCDGGPPRKPWSASRIYGCGSARMRSHGGDCGHTRPQPEGVSRWFTSVDFGAGSSDLCGASDMVSKSAFASAPPCHFPRPTWPPTACCVLAPIVPTNHPRSPAASVNTSTLYAQCALTLKLHEARTHTASTASASYWVASCQYSPVSSARY